MDKKLTKHGNSLALIIDKPILQLLKIDEKTQLTISISGDSLVITPAKKRVKSVPVKTKKSTKEIAKRIMETHDATFKKLAKT